MPKFKYFVDGSGSEWVWRFRLSPGDAACSPTEAADAFLRVERKDAAVIREGLLSVAKQCGKEGDREGARMLGDLAKEQMRRYRAACLCLGWIAPASELPGDCKPSPPSSWPVELADEIDLIYATALLQPAGVEIAGRGGK